MPVRPLLLTAAATFLIAGAAVAQRPNAPGGRSQGRPGAAREAVSDSAAADTAGVPVAERVSVTHHTTTINGRPIAYTARTGTMVLKDENGKPKAQVFYISYSKDGEDLTKRPVTFFFNGGPG